MYSSSCWRCTPKTVPFLPRLVYEEGEWTSFLQSVCPRFNVTSADILVFFKRLCRAVDFPNAVVRIRQSFYVQFDQLSVTVLRLLALHANQSGAWTVT